MLRSLQEFLGLLMDTAEEEALLSFELTCIERPPSPEQANQARAVIAKNPDDIRSRLQLYGQLVRLRADGEPVALTDILEQVEHFVLHAPFLGATNCNDEALRGLPNELERLRRAWKTALQTQGHGVRVFENALTFMDYWGDQAAFRVATELRRLGATSWNAQALLGAFFLRRCEEACENSTTAADHFDRALALARPPANRFEGQAALASYLAGRTERARELATRAVELRGFNLDINVHLGQTVTGLLALDARDAGAAESALKSSCVRSVPANGPSFRLATRLLREGNVHVVKAYLGHMATVWRRGADRCRAWSFEIEAGGVPEMTNSDR
ncbi:MAG: hypothetical protein IPM79_36760 [Polyangiaceae bacterium]|jgi:tetratricopeptide (TPR) repeat protein|nr:hypothetical protein [Polyangiaceae bacterium]